MHLITSFCLPGIHNHAQVPPTKLYGIEDYISYWRVSRLTVEQTHTPACQMPFSLSRDAKMRCGFRLQVSKTSSSKCHHSRSSESHITLMLEVVTRWWRTSCHKTQIPLCTWHFLPGQTENVLVSEFRAEWYNHVPSLVTLSKLF
jgi:hypothetical protein